MLEVADAKKKLSLVYHTEEDSIVVHTMEDNMQARKQILHTKRLCKACKCKSGLQKCKSFFALLMLRVCEIPIHQTYTRLLCNSRTILISFPKFFEESRRFWQQSRLHMNQRGKRRSRRTKKSNNFCLQVVFTGLYKATGGACSKG